MKVLYIVLMLVLLMSCNSNHQKDIKTSYDKQELLFTSSGVNDSLYSFISSIDSIPNPYGQSIEYMVRYSIEDEDTIITFHAAVDFTPATDMSLACKHDSSPEIIIGGAYCGDKPVLVRSSGRYDYPLLRKEMLDESTGMKIDSVKIPLDNPMGWDAPMTLTYKRYKYSYPDSLTLYEYWHLGKLVFER
ncbi:MAG: hypothetical protein J6Q63_03260 [Bacteroidales bacterium]|nr:hypothetical protein [Bacteroidales bacterium]